MSIRTPILDDRTYAQLRDELVARIPVYAPEWTDHEPSDPGITLIELFAFLGENLLYRFNQIPDTTRMAFLDLLRIDTRPAAAASGTVAFSTKNVSRPLVPLRTSVSAGSVPFETLDEVTVLPVRGLAAVREAVPLPGDVETLEYVTRVSQLVGRSVADVSTYRTVFGAADPTRPGGDALDPGTGTVDGILWVALVADTPATVEAARAALAGARLSIGLVVAEDVPVMADLDACPGGAGGRPTPSTEWQLSTTRPDPGSTAVPPDPVWLRLAVESDTTAGLTRSGIVGLRLPPSTTDVGVYAPADPEAAGAGDQPPLVDDDDLAACVVAWLRAFRPDGTPVSRLDWLGANASRIEQAQSAGAEFLGVGTGQPDQQVQLVHGSVLGADAGVQVEEPGAGWVGYPIGSDFNASSADSRHAVLDRALGVVRFGDGLRGRCPQIGERIRTVGYRYGGGTAGNVAAGAVTKLDVTGVKVANPLPTRGGSAAETTAEAVQRMPGEIRRHDRAVTASDFRELAVQTPGAGVVRAETLPLFDPHNPGTEVPGAVTVVVWPGSPAAGAGSPDAPLPTRSQLDAVCGWLDARRLVTTELYVVPPTYRDIAVSVGVAVKPGYGTEAVRRWTEQLLHQYLSSVPPFGPEGSGWPLGRRVHGPELEAAVLQVEGVEYLDGLRLAVADPAAASGYRELDPPTLVLAPYEVPRLGVVSAVAGAAPEPGVVAAAPAPSGPPVPVRSPREVC